MDLATERVVPQAAFRIPIVLLIVIALVVAAVVALAVAAKPDTPAPFGPARNGSIVYASGGDLYGLASERSEPQLLVGGPEFDRDPAFAPRGDRLLFYRTEDTGTSLLVVRPDGTDLSVIAGPLIGLDWASWSPDGTRVAFHQRPGGRPVVSVVDVDSGEIHDLDLPNPSETPITWRPGHENQLLVRTRGDDEHYRLMLVDVRTGDRRVLGIPSEDGAPIDPEFGAAGWSPDGRRLVVKVGRGLSQDAPHPMQFLKVIDVDDDGGVTAIRPFIHDRTADYEDFGTFTPDGRSLMFVSQRGCTSQVWLSPVDADPAVAAIPASEPMTASWDCSLIGIIPYLSPDGTRVVAAMRDRGREDILSIDGIGGGAAPPLQSRTSGSVAWQRLAP